MSVTVGVGVSRSCPGACASWPSLCTALALAAQGDLTWCWFFVVGRLHDCLSSLPLLKALLACFALPAGESVVLMCWLVPLAGVVLANAQPVLGRAR